MQRQGIATIKQLSEISYMKDDGMNSSQSKE
jgi:hypothetical protein